MLLYFCFIYIGCYINNGVFKMNEQDRKKLRHLKNQLKQVKNNSVLTDYEMKWKESEINYIQRQIDEIQENNRK